MFLVGSMYAKRLPVGAIVLPTQVDDMAGVVKIDDPDAGPATPDEQILEQVRSELRGRGVEFTEGRTFSTPAVLHGIEHVSEAVRRDHEVIGVEMETSTFLHFARKHGVKAGALLYVSDNDRHSIISKGKNLRAARLDGLRIASSVAVSVLRHF
jgi:purine-nucleoside phosphorylase